MRLDRIIKNLDITKIKSSSGVTYAQELINAANLLRNCIQSRINHESLGGCISVSDLADVKTDGLSLIVTLKIDGVIRPSIFNEWNMKNANIFWLLNDGFTVKKTWAFNGFAHPERWIYRAAERFVEKGIEDFNGRKTLPIKVKMVKRPLVYYG